MKFHAGDFSLDHAPWLGGPVEADSDQTDTLIENSQCLYHEGDGRHSQNVQINKVIGENENSIFLFYRKTARTFWPTRYSINCYGKDLLLES